MPSRSRAHHYSVYVVELADENLKRLKEAGLIASWERRPDGLWWTVSEEGHKLHAITRNLILSSVRLSATPKTN